MMTALGRVLRVERERCGEVELPGGLGVVLGVRVRVTTPGECCVAIASSLRFEYDPPLPDDIAVRLDDRLYDGLYAGLATLDGPLPPGHLQVAVVEVRAVPSLASLVGAGDWAVIGALGDALAERAVAAVAEAAGALLVADVAEPLGALA